MTPDTVAALRQQIKRDEGLRLQPYIDTVGKVSIGYGRNLSDNGITQSEADDMLNQDLARHLSDLRRAFPIVDMLDPVRQIVLGNMCFNLGIVRLGAFTRMWGFLKRHNYEGAAQEILASLWAEQVGARATRLAEAMRSGEFK